MSKLPKSIAKKAAVYQAMIVLKCKEHLEGREV